MSLTAVVAGTPFYVLMDGNRRIGPKIVDSASGTPCAPIYGFSDKGLYVRFCRNCARPLTPYPLVKFYLREHSGMSSEGLQLVVVDATGPREHHLYAATTDAVLEAHENRTTHVIAAYHLTLDPLANAYRVAEATV